MLQARPGLEGSPPPALPPPSPSAFAGLTPEAVRSQANPVFDDHMEEATEETTSNPIATTSSSNWINGNADLAQTCLTTEASTTEQTTSNPTATTSSENRINTNDDLAKADFTAKASGDVSMTAASQAGSSRMSSSGSQPDSDPPVSADVSSFAKTGSAAVAQNVTYSTGATQSADPAIGAETSMKPHDVTARPGFPTTASTAYTPSAGPLTGADASMIIHDLTARPGSITPASTGKASATPDKQSTADYSGRGLQSQSSTEHRPESVPANDMSTAVARGQPDTKEARGIKVRAVKRVLSHPANQQTSGVAPCSTLADSATAIEATSDDRQGSFRASHRPLTDTCNVLQQQAASAPETVDPPVNSFSAPVNVTGVNL